MSDEDPRHWMYAAYAFMRGSVEIPQLNLRGIIGGALREIEKLDAQLRRLRTAESMRSAEESSTERKLEQLRVVMFNVFDDEIDTIPKCDLAGFIDGPTDDWR